MTRQVLLRPLAKLFGAAVSAREWLYESGYLETHRLPVPVVSVGNLTVGGTGKTPFVAELLQWAETEGLKAGVISRGYGRAEQGVRRVQTCPDSARLFGDEPTMLASRFPQTPIYVGARRIEAGRKLLDENQVDFIIADDAFQHWELHRDLDVVLIDAMEPKSNYALLPEGRAREDWTALTRAHFVVLTKCNLVAPEQKRQRLEIIASRFNGPIIECEYAVKELNRWGRGGALGTEDKVLLVSGIGRPESFARVLEPLVRVAGHLAFADHHRYTAEDIARITAAAADQQCVGIVTTEKDAVKLSAAVADLPPTWVARLTPKYSDNMTELYDAIRGLLR